MQNKIHTGISELLKCIRTYLILTSLSLALSVPLTNTIKPSSRAIERFKWMMLCPVLNAAFLFRINAIRKTNSLHITYVYTYTVKLCLQ